MTTAPPTAIEQRALWLLRGQLLLSGGLIVVGAALSLSQTGALPGTTQDLHRLAAGLAGGDAASLVSMGFVLLILTPVMRLLTTAGRFVREQDWRFVGVTGVVLTIVVSGLLLGRH
jgi:uncharacterized membrane protein